MKETSFPNGNRNVSTNFEGIRLEGYLTFVSSSDYLVRIEKPFKGLIAGLHIPYFAMPQKKWYVLDNMITEECYTCAERSLIKLYSIGKIIIDNITTMIKLMPEYEKIQILVVEEIKKLKEKEREFSNQLKTSEISSEQFEVLSKQILHEIVDLEITLRNTFNRLYDHYFSMIIPVDMHKQIIPFMRDLG